MDDLIVFSVFEITRHLKQVVETQIEPLYVRGEISNFTRHSSPTRRYAAPFSATPTST